MVLVEEHLADRSLRVGQIPRVPLERRLGPGYGPSAGSIPPDVCGGIALGLGAGISWPLGVMPPTKRGGPVAVSPAISGFAAPAGIALTKRFGRSHALRRPVRIDTGRGHGLLVDDAAPFAVDPGIALAVVGPALEPATPIVATARHDEHAVSRRGRARRLACL